MPRAAPFRRHGVPTLTQRLTRKRPVGHARFKCRHPRLAERLFQIYFVGIPRGERALTPDSWAEKGLKSRENRLHHGLGGGLCTGKEFFQSPEPFLDALDRSRIRKAKESGRTERFARNQGHVRLFKQQLRKLRAVFSHGILA